MYGIATAVSRSFSLITLPVLTRHLSLTEYGQLDYCLALTTFFVTVFVFGQDSSVARLYYEYDSDDDRKQVISQSLAVQLIILSLALPVVWAVLNNFLASRQSYPSDSLLLTLVLLQVPFGLLINFCQNLLKWTFRRTCFLSVSLGATGLQCLSILSGVLLLKFGLKEILTIYLVCNIIFALLGLFFVRSCLQFPSGFKHVVESLPISIPFGITSVAASFLPNLERSMTYSLLGSDDLGLYAVALRVSSIAALLGFAFQMAWSPFFLSLHRQPDASLTYNTVFRYFAIGACILSLLTALLSRPLISILATSKFEGAAIVVFPLVLSVAVQTTSWISEIGITISKRGYLNLYAYVPAIAASYFTILWLTPLIGLAGVGFGVLSGAATKATLASWLAQRAYPLPWQYRPVLGIIGTTSAGGTIAVFCEQQSCLFERQAILFITIVLVFIISWRSAISNSERCYIKNMIKTALRRAPE